MQRIMKSGMQIEEIVVVHNWKVNASVLSDASVVENISHNCSIPAAYIRLGRPSSNKLPLATTVEGN